LTVALLLKGIIRVINLLVIELVDNNKAEIDLSFGPRFQEDFFVLGSRQDEVQKTGLFDWLEVVVDEEHVHKIEHSVVSVQHQVFIFHQPVLLPKHFVGLFDI
jgi:hypothetical protein